MASTERTPLTGGGAAPQYVFTTHHSRLYRGKVKQCQCCICAALLSIFVVAIVITVSYSVNHDTEDTTNTTSTGTTPSTTPLTTPPTPGTSALNLTSFIQDLMSQTFPFPEDSSEWPEPQPTEPEMEAALEVGKEALRSRDFMEESTVPLETDSPSNRHQTAMGTGEAATTYARAGFIMDRATRELVHRDSSLTRIGRGRGPRVNAEWLPEEVCGDAPKFVDLCTKTPYRSVDGTCNNPNFPLKWGVALRPFRRLLPPDYADGVSEPRAAISGAALPSARAVSVLVHRPVYQDDPKFTVMLAVWGQFMDHDITATALSKGANSSTISCCYAIDTPELMHPECFPVRLDPEDSYYQKFNVTCMEFVRSAPAPVCSLGPREQLNQASSFLDGSVVYGADEELVKKLRSFKGGELRMEKSPDGRELLPYDDNPDDGCNQAVQAAKNKYCFLSGDKRANENLHLTTMHLLFARQHNYLARKLMALNPAWNDERTFQEARRILAAQLQHITYKEFVPILLGGTLVSRLNISLKDSGYHNVYNASVDPTVANGFAASAFRFAHTLLPSLFRQTAKDNSSDDYVELHKLLFDPFQLYSPGRMDSTLNGAFSTNAQKIDTYFTNEVTQKLFEGPAKTVTPAYSHKPGLDLVSLNIQRGRDHGLPPYTAWRKMCGLSVPKDFNQLDGVMDPDSIQRLATMYTSIDDMDMYSGALSEIPVTGGQLGPTVLCVLSDHFYRMKVGDRFWYETPHEPQAFTPEQLQEIRKTTLAGIICVNSDNIEKAQPWVMRLKKAGNYPVPCFGDVILHADLSLWEEKNGTFTRPGVGRVKLGAVNHVRAMKATSK